MLSEGSGTWCSRVPQRFGEELSAQFRKALASVRPLLYVDDWLPKKLAAELLEAGGNVAMHGSVPFRSKD